MPTYLDARMITGLDTAAAVAAKLNRDGDTATNMAFSTGSIGSAVTLPIGNGSWARPLVDRFTTLSVEDFRYDGLTLRNDFDTLRAAIVKAIALGGTGELRLGAKTYAIGGGYLCPDGWPSNWSLKGVGWGASILSVTSVDPTGLGNVINTRGSIKSAFSDFGITYGAGLALGDYAIVMDAGADQVVENIQITRGYGSIDIGRTGNVNRGRISNITHSSWRAGLAGDHIRLRQLSSLAITRTRCNTSEELAAGTAFYGLRPDNRISDAGGPGHGVDTVVFTACQGQNSTSSGYSNGYGLLIDGTYGDCTTGTFIAGVDDHSFGGAVVIKTGPWIDTGVNQKPVITDHTFIGYRFTEDGASTACLRFDHQGYGDVGGFIFNSCTFNSSVTPWVRIEAAANGTFAAPQLIGCRYKAIGSASQTIATGFSVDAPIDILGGRVSRYQYVSGTFSPSPTKLGQIGSGVRISCTGLVVTAGTVVDPTFGQTGSTHLDTMIRDNPGVLQEVPIDGANYATKRWLLTGATKRPAAARRTAYDDYVQALVNEGLWPKLAALFVLSATESGLALRDLYVPTRTATVIGTMPFVADRGFTSNGSTGVIDTGLTAASLGLSINSFTLIQSVGTNVQADSQFDVSLGANVRINGRNAAGSLFTRTGSATTVSVAAADSIGTFAVSRSGPTASALYSDGAPVATDATASIAFAGAEKLLIGAGSGSTNMSTRQQAMTALFKVALTDAEVLIEYNARKTLLQAIGVAI